MNEVEKKILQVVKELRVCQGELRTGTVDWKEVLGDKLSALHNAKSFVEVAIVELNALAKGSGA